MNTRTFLNGVVLNVLRPLGGVVLLSLLALSPNLLAQAVVVPSAYESAEGGGGSSLLNDNIRLQEIFDASSLPGGPITITEIRFRPSARYGAAFSATISNINIRMSTTQVAARNLSPTFSANVGANETVVFDGALPLSSSYSGSATGTKAFDIVVTLTTPFTYNPAAGNLLIDYRNYSGSAVTYIDAGSSPDQKANRAFALGAESTTATTVDFGSEVVQLVYAPVESPPVIVTQPSSRTVAMGSTATLSVTVASAVPVTYQWKHDGAEIAGATAASLVISNVQPADAGVYVVVVANQFGSVTSSNAVLTVTDPPPPVIVSQPSSQTVLPGGVAAFSVSVNSVEPTLYSWRREGVPIDGATNASLVLSNVQPAQAGGYSVVVSNPYGSATSAVATLTVSSSIAFVVPPIYANQEAGAGAGSLTHPIRLQEVYSSSYFPEGQILISELRWRPSATTGRASSTIMSNLQLNLSTTLRQPGQLSATFSDNVGQDDTVVFQGSLAVTSTFAGPVSGPKEFDIIVPLSTPFLYDSSMGNLLLEIRRPDYTGVSPVDANCTPDGTVSRAFAVGAESTSATTLDCGADVLRIEYSGSAIPPYISRHPQSQHVTEGTTATLSVVARGATPLTYQWYFNDNSIADATASSLVISNATPAAAGDYFVVVENALGSATSHVATIAVDLSRALGLVTPTERQEGSLVNALVDLDSDGDVGGMTFILRYNTNHLKNAQLTWEPTLEGLFNTVNYSTPGQIRATFALAGTALPGGLQPLASVEFLLRSVPTNLDSALTLEIIDVSDPTGDPIAYGNLVRDASIRITKRVFTGDNNANQRLDVGDATVILRHLAFLEETRPWDVMGNDLNSNANLDSGDAIKVLRAAAGIDPQPGGGGGGGGFVPAGNGPGVVVLPVESIILSPPSVRSEAGSLVTFQVSLRDVRSDISGAAFTLAYPTNALRLLNSQAYHTGSLVPGNSLTVWNVAPSQNNFVTQSGRISFASSSAGLWTSSNGVLAEITFQVQAGASSRYLWPLTLSNAEISPGGYGNHMLLPSGAVFIGRDPVPGAIAAPVFNASGHFEFTAVGDAGANYSIESSSDLIHWNPISTFLNTTGSFVFEDPTSGGEPSQFYRVRLLGE